MPEPPTLETRDAVDYVAIRRAAPFAELPATLDRGFPEFFGALLAHGLTPSGPPFVRYFTCDPAGGFELEIGVPVGGATPPADAEFHAADLPAGRYVVHLHRGAYRATTPAWEGRDLAAANEHIDEWAWNAGVTWAMRPAEDGGAPRFAARLERYLVGPLDSTDPADWQTELAILVND